MTKPWWSGTEPWANVLWLLLRCGGASQIVLWVVTKIVKKIALESGATAVVAERGEEVIAKVREIRGGGADAALECVGTAAAVDQALEVLHNGGRLGFVGVPHYNNRALGSTFAQISQLQVELPLLPPTTNSYYSRLYWMEISIQDESSPRAIVWTRLIKHTKTWMSVRPLRLWLWLTNEKILVDDFC